MNPDSPQKTIFIMTAMKIGPDNSKVRDRVWAWYPTFKEAERDVLANATDMFEENYYNHAVIEEVRPGLCTAATVRGWYFADYEGVVARPGYLRMPKVSKIDPPVWAKGLVNWGIG